MGYILKATPEFWKSFHALSPLQQELAREKLKIFEINPYDPRLHPHKIHKLSSRMGRNVQSVTIEGNLRAVFYQLGNEIHSFDIGTHDVYK